MAKLIGPRPPLIVLTIAVAMLAAYSVYRWRTAAPSTGRQNDRIVASGIEANDPTVNPPTASGSPSHTGATKQSRFQLHAAFRESQRCILERMISRANLGGTAPPHILGCDDMKGALQIAYEATKAAAQSGDIDAQMCYLMQIAGDRDTGFMLSDAEIAEYRSLAPQYVDAAFQRGDWRVVELLGFHVVDSPGLFVYLEQWRDPAREYKAHRLLLLGAGDVVAHGPDYWLPALGMPESTLSAEGIRDSDAWAQEMYDKYFSSQPALIKEPTVCSEQDETK